MDAAEKLGEERRLIFENVANGVPLETIMAAFKRSEAEVHHEWRFVLKKIMEYRYRRLREGSPHARYVLNLQTIHDVRANRIDLLDTLRRIGNITLSTELLVPNLAVQTMEREDDHIEEVTHRMNHG